VVIFKHQELCSEMIIISIVELSSNRVVNFLMGTTFEGVATKTSSGWYPEFMQHLFLSACLGCVHF